MKKVLFALLAALSLTAARADLSGSIGTNTGIFYEYYTSSGLLKIFRDDSSPNYSGVMPDFDYADVPWASVRNNIQKITIVEGITNLGNQVFFNHTSVTSVSLPSSLTSIGANAFAGCTALESVTLPGSLTGIGNGTFEGCTSLRSVTLPSTMTSIGTNVFRGCKALESITLPGSLTSIGDMAFSDCTALESITFPGSLTSIGARAFSGCKSLESVSLPGTMTSIGTNVFEGCTSLRSVSLPDSLTSIGTRVFLGCTALESITLPSSLTSIGEGAFMVCGGLTTLTVPDGVEVIGKDAFYGCKNITSLTLGSNLREIGEGAFSGCGLTTLTIPDGVEVIGKQAFKDCKNITLLTLGSNLIEIGEGAFRRLEGLTTLTIPDGVEVIGKEAFYGCSNITSLTLGSNLREIGEEAFYGYEGLTTLTIPDGVEVIGKQAFFGCKNITSLTLGSNLREIGEGAFKFYEGLTTLTIPDGVEVIGKQAFYGCKNITSLTLGSNLREIGEEAFCYCEGLTTLTVPDKVEVIGKQAFYGCKNITSLTLGSNLREIGEEAFWGCEGLTTPTIPDRVEVIGANAFEWCKNITSLTLGSNLREIGEYAFRGCESLTTLIIPERVTSIHEGAFLGCEGMTDIYCHANPDSLAWTIEGFKENNETRFHVLDIDYNAGKWNSFIANGAQVTIVGDITGLIITFNTGGKGTVPESQKLWLGKLATEPPLQFIGEAGSEEYLEGWYTNQALTQSFDFTVAPNQTMTLYAKWAAAARFDFNVTNPEGGTCTLTDAKGRVLDHGPAIPGNCKLTVTPKEGYNYSGSYTLKHRTDHTSFMPTQISGDNERSYNVNMTQYDLTVNVSFVALPIATVTVKDNGIVTGYSYTLQYVSGQDCPNGSVIAQILDNPNDPGASWNPQNSLRLTINDGTDGSLHLVTICNNGKITKFKSNQTTYDIIPEGSVDITLFFYDSGKNIALSDNGDNSSTLAAICEYRSFWNVTLQGRTLYRDGCWNTLCLPFSVHDFIGTPLENADVRELTAASLDGTTLTLNFRAATDIEGGKPYIVKWPIDADIVNPVFTGVMIDSYYQLREASFGTVSFRGTYTGQTFTDENPNILFMGANNTLYYPLAGATIGAQRAYFQLAGGASANNFVLTFDDDDEEPSAIASDLRPQTSNINDVWFDLQGRKVQNPQKGNIYIRGRKKIIY